MGQEILVVDDEIDIRSLIADILHDEDISVGLPQKVTARLRS